MSDMKWEVRNHEGKVVATGLAKGTTACRKASRPALQEKLNNEGSIHIFRPSEYQNPWTIASIELKRNGRWVVNLNPAKAR